MVVEFSRPKKIIWSKLGQEKCEVKNSTTFKRHNKNKVKLKKFIFSILNSVAELKWWFFWLQLHFLLLFRLCLQLHFQPCFATFKMYLNSSNISNMCQWG